MSTASQLLGLNSVPIGGLVPVSGAVVTTDTPYLKADGSEIVAADYPLISGNLPASLNATIAGLPGSSTLIGVAYGNSRWVAVVAGSTTTYVLVSTDGGNSWFYTVTQAFTYMRTIVFGSGMFIAVTKYGFGVQPFTSTDGITWTPQATLEVPGVTDQAYPALATYTNGYFIIPFQRYSLVTYNLAHMVYSSDGINWNFTSYINNYTYGKLSAVAYGAGLYVVTTEDGYTLTAPTLTSTWTVRTNTATGSGGWSDVIFANGCFVSVQGRIGAGTSFGYSTDGITWTQKTVPSGRYFRVKYEAGLFVAIGYNVCVTSPDGQTWTARTIPTGNWYDLGYSASNGFIAISDASTALTAKSTDGITWTTGNSGGAISNMREICYGTAYGYMTASLSSLPVLTSTDGITWTPRANAPTQPDCVACKPDGSIYLMLSGSSPVLYTTSDFVTWTSRSVVATGGMLSSSFPKLRWVNDRFFITNINTSYQSTIQSSTNGINWTTASSVALPANTQLTGIAYGNGVFVASTCYRSNLFTQTIMESRTNYVSTGNTVWYTVNSLPPAIWSDIAFGNGVFVMISSKTLDIYSSMLYTAGAGPYTGYMINTDTPNTTGRMCAVSTNGAEWKVAYLPVVGEWSSIVFNGHYFIAAQSKNSKSVAISKDGFNWALKDIGIFGPWSNLAIGASNSAAMVATGIPYTSVKMTESPTNVFLPYVAPSDGVNYVVKVK